MKNWSKINSRKNKKLQKKVDIIIICVVSSCVVFTWS